MNWRIRMNITNERKQRHMFMLTSIDRFNSSWNRVTIAGHRISSTRVNHKRNLPIDTTSNITIEKKRKSSDEPSRIILVCGQNICGQLGLSTTVIERRKLQHLKIVNKFNIEENIQDIYAGGMHSCALTKTGYVYTWGCNDDGALGRLTDDIMDEYTPGLFVLPEEIQSLCAGDTFTLALAKSGRAYISGCFRSSEGILGLFEYKQIAQQSVMVPCTQKIRQIACGADFCLLLTEHGDLYSFGNNEIGQLGRDAHVELNEKFSVWLKPLEILFFKGYHIVNMWAGGHGFFVIAEQNSSYHLFACGANSFGQLGDPLKQPIYSPIEVKGFLCVDKIMQIACGLQHTLILDSSGLVHGLGRSDDGRLGYNLNHDITIPKQIDSLIDICDIAAGGCVSFAVNRNGQIYSFGMGDTCQIGHGKNDIFVPTLVTSKQLEQRKIQHVSVGAQHTLFLVEQN